ncbi:MAG: HAMP domain-containing sensor histidine kinase [Candidatus Solibacter sp.]
MKTGNPRRITLSWLIVGGLFLLCGFLGVLQYRWIGEVSAAARDRLRGGLQASLFRISQEFSSELANACRALLVPSSGIPEKDIAANYAQWKNPGRNSQMFRHIAVAIPVKQSVELRMLDTDKAAFVPAEWPAEWSGLQARLENLLNSEMRQGRSFPGPPMEDQGMTFDLPVFGPVPGTANGGRGNLQFSRAESPSLIFELNPDYVRETMLPELLQHHLGSGGTLDYMVEIQTRQTPAKVIFQSDPGAHVALNADGVIGLFDTPYDQIFRGGGGRGGRERGGGRGPGFGPGRWQLFVRHRAGSLEAAVAQARWRNLAVTAGVLLLMMASVGALITFTRRAQKLADLQLDFVAGISHELRTPLTVIHTAAYNLRGKLAANPAQVERYGVLIQQESGRLKDLVEQVLRFSSAASGHVIQNPEPMSISNALEETLDSAKAVLQGAGCTVEAHIDPGLPVVMGDPMALKQALLNLVHNAVKYGAGDSRWVGVSASRVGGDAHPGVEIRVADRGPGIPADEQAHVFDPFFRGRAAQQDQIHGTGLGLHLARKIFEAHGGSIQVKSAAQKGAEFIVRLPAAPGAAA